jgi:hypothetical protein
MRLQNNAASMPKGVGDAIASLSGTVTKMITCPSGTQVTMVTVNSTTTLVHWDPALAESNTAGTYKWECTSMIQGGKKVVTCRNWIMLDPAVTAASEVGTDLDKLSDEGLLYHELLHGQLLIDAMTNDANWQKKVCNCQFDLGPSDPGHSVIDPAVDGYLENRARGTANVTVVKPPKQKADQDGSFDITLGAAQKETFTFTVLFPSDGGNVDPQSITVEIINGKFHVKGKLIDKSKPGRFFLRIDPPAEWIVVGIEGAVVVLPAVGTAVPMLSMLALLVLVLLLIGVALRRSRAARVGMLSNAHRPWAARKSLPPASGSPL